MRSFPIFIFTLIATTVFTAGALAGPKECENLTGDKKILADNILNSEHPYNCCDETIAKCLQKPKPCALAVRLATTVCKRVAKGESETKIKKRLQKRAESLNPNQKKATVNTLNTVAAGASNAPVKVVVYACARCPFCSKIVPALYKEVTQGKLKGKVVLYFKPFPLKSHKYSKEGGLAMIAASHLGKFWPYVLKIYNEFDMFSVEKLDDWAASEGMNKNKFNKLMKDSATRATLVESKKEGLANGVKATPQLFINGKKYKGFLDLEELIDVLEEEAEATKNNTNE